MRVWECTLHILGCTQQSGVSKQPAWKGSLRGSKSIKEIMERNRIRHSTPSSCVGTPGLTLDLHMCRSDPNQMNRLWELNYGAENPAGSILVTRWHTQGADPNNSAKTLKTELSLEPQPTEGWLEPVAWIQPDQLPAKTQIPTFSLGFKQKTPGLISGHSDCQSTTQNYSSCQEPGKYPFTWEKR